MLGLKMAPAQTGFVVASSRPSQVTLPLILQNIDPAALGFDDHQQQAITSVRRDFLDEIGGTNQDPNDPSYLARWEKARPAADDMLQAMLGNDAYTKYELVAFQTALGKPGSPAK